MQRSTDNTPHIPPTYHGADLDHNTRDVDGSETSTSQEVTQTQTRVSVISRVVSSMPNPEATSAKKESAPHLKKFSYGLFDPEMAQFRAIVMKMLVGTAVMVTIVMWLATPVFWGSLWKANSYTDKLTVRVIDRDGGFIGTGVSEFLLAQPKLGYFSTPASEFPDAAAVEHDIVQEGAWASVVISAGASERLDTARANADPNFNPMEAIHFVFAQARNEQGTGSYLLPLAQGHLANITGQLSAQSVAQFLQSGGNATALAAAPRTLSQAVGFTVVNVRPYNQSVATAITFVGLIFGVIFCFIITMANNAAREVISPYLTTRAYLLYRIIVPLTLYVALSFFLAMVNLPFKVDFGAHYTYAGGFFLWWFILYLAMSACGLATEFAITIVGPRFIAFFLVPLIIVNVSGVTVPRELQPWFYKYSLAMPFYNASRGVRTIIFNTKNDIAQNCGILLAWVVTSIITITLATWLYRRKAINEHIKAMGEEERDIKAPDGREV